MNADFFDTVIGGLKEVASYSRQKALYEADCRIRAKLAEARRALYSADSSRCLCSTVELQRSKLKLEFLKRQTDKLPPDLAVAYADLIDEVEARITVLRGDRRRASCVC